MMERCICEKRLLLRRADCCAHAHRCTGMKPDWKGRLLESDCSDGQALLWRLTLTRGCLKQKVTLSSSIKPSQTGPLLSDSSNVRLRSK